MYSSLNAGALGIRANLPETIALARDHGFEGVDFSIGEAADLADRHGLPYVQALFASAKVKPGSWDFPVNFRQDEATWQQHLAALPRLANLAQSLDCQRTATWIMPCSDELEFQANFDFHVARLQPAAKILSDYGCRLGLEFVGPKTLRMTQRYEFIYSLAGMLELCRAIGAGNVGLLLDSYHLYTSHGSLAEVQRLTHQQIVTVHVNDAPAGVPVDEQLDNVRALPGETGVLDMSGFLQTLQSIGYDGPVTPEPFSQRLRTLPPAEAAQEAGQAMRRVWQVAGLQ
jgi:sugar phosphate isomerase/epimerase